MWYAHFSADYVSYMICLSICLRMMRDHDSWQQQYTVVDSKKEAFMLQREVFCALQNKRVEWRIKTYDRKEWTERMPVIDEWWMAKAFVIKEPVSTIEGPKNAKFWLDLVMTWPFCGFDVKLIVHFCFRKVSRIYNWPFGNFKVISCMIYCPVSLLVVILLC